MHTTGRMPDIASPAANVTACCSQMPTSKNRSGNSLAKLSSPVDEPIAAVIAQTSGRRVAAVMSASPKTSVYVRSVDRGRPVSGSKALTPCSLSISSSTAGPYPCPFSVTTCTTTGACSFFARESTASRSASSWPSTTPAYFMPRLSKTVEGWSSCLRPSLTRYAAWSAVDPTSGRSRRRREISSLMRSYRGSTRN